MMAKIEPCLTESRRHNWLHEGNKTVLSELAGYFTLSRRGVYQCTACGRLKYGPAQDQLHVRVEPKP